MMRLACWMVVLLGLTLTGLCGQEEFEIPPGAETYHTLLRNNPRPGVLLDRFRQAWVEAGQGAHLQAFLEAQGANGSEADSLLLAFFHEGQGDSALARKAYDRALSIEPASVAARYYRARLLTRLRAYDEALVDLEAARSAPLEGEFALWIPKLEGQILARSGQFEQAAKILTQLIEEQKDDLELAEEIVEIMIREGLFEAALATNQSLAEKTADPYQKTMRRIRQGDILERAGRDEEALAAYSKTLASVGVETWWERDLLGRIEVIFGRTSDPKSLVEHYQGLAEQGPHRVALEKKLIAAFVQSGQSEAADERFRQLVGQHPGRLDLQLAWIDFLAAQGSLAEAIQRLEALSQEHPNQAEISWRLASLYHKSQANQKIAPAMRRFLEASDKAPHAFHRAIQSLIQFEMPEEALALYRELVAKFPDDLDLREGLATFLLDLDRLEEGLALMETLGAESQADRLLRIGQVLTDRDQEAKALELLASRLDEFRIHPDYLPTLCRFAVSLEQLDRAVTWARAYLAQADTPKEFDESLRLNLSIARKGEFLETWITELERLKNPSVQDQALLLELYEEQTHPKASALLQDWQNSTDLIRLSRCASIHRRRRAWPQVQRTLERLVQIGKPTDVMWLQELAALAQREGDFEVALQWLDRWKTMTPEAEQVWLEEAQCLIQAGDAEAALARLQAASGKFEDNQAILEQIAELAIDLGDWDRAEETYFRLCGQAASMHQKLAWVQKMAQSSTRFDQSKRLMDRFGLQRDQNPRSLAPRLFLAEVYRALGQTEQERQTLLEAYTIAPTDVGLLQAIARIELQEGHWQKAVATWERIGEIDSSLPTNLQIAEIILTHGEDDAAERLSESLATDPETDEARVLALAKILAENRRWERAGRFLARQKLRFPESVPIAYSLAHSLSESEATAEALEAFHQALELLQRKHPPPRPADEFLAFLPEAMYPVSQTLNLRLGNFSGPISYLAFSGLTMLDLAEKLPPDQLQQTIQRLEENGFPYARFLPGCRERLAGICTEYLSGDTVDPVAVALLAVTAFQRPEQALNSEWPRLAYPILDQHYPEAGLRLRLAEARSHEAGAKEFESTVAAILQREDFNPWLVRDCLRLIDDTKAEHLSAEVRARAFEQIEKAWPKFPSPPTGFRQIEPRPT